MTSCLDYKNKKENVIKEMENQETSRQVVPTIKQKAQNKKIIYKAGDDFIYFIFNLVLHFAI